MFMKFLDKKVINVCHIRISKKKKKNLLRKCNHKYFLLTDF